MSQDIIGQYAFSEGREICMKIWALPNIMLTW